MGAQVLFVEFCIDGMARIKGGKRIVVARQVSEIHLSPQITRRFCSCCPLRVQYLSSFRVGDLLG